MSERGSHSKSKSLNLQEFSEINKSCTRFLEPEGLELENFLMTGRMLEMKLEERDPDDGLVTKDITAAITKAISEGLVKIIRLLNSDSQDSLTQLKTFIQCFLPICWDFSFLLMKGNITIKVKKIIIGQIDDVLSNSISKLPASEFLSICFVLINTLIELALSKKRKIDCKECDLADEIYEIIKWVLKQVMTVPQHSALSTSSYQISKHDKKVTLFWNSYHDVIDTDLVHFLLLCIEHLIKIENSIASDFTKNLLSQILVYLLDVSEFNASLLSNATELAIQKYLISLTILKSLCSPGSKTEVVKIFLKSNSEKIKNIFYYTLLSYTKYYFVMNGNNFELDNDLLGKLYKTLYDILSAVAVNSEQEGFPILLFSVILQKVFIM